MSLFAYQIFISILLNGDNIFGTDLTGGVNGILKVDPLSFFGHVVPVSKDGVFNVAYLYVALGVLHRPLRRPALRRPLAHRPRLALAARGLARRPADGDARPRGSS